MKFFLSILFLLLVLTPFVPAQPPQAQVVINLENGFNIDIPKVSSIPQNRDFDFDFHVFNISNGLKLDNSTGINCSFELSDNTGNNLVDIEEIPFVEDHWVLEVGGGNFTRMGDYFYLVDCSSDNLAGSISVIFEVTADGFRSKVFPTQFVIIILGLFLVLVGIFNDRLRFMQLIGSMMLIIMGVLTLYPGYSFISWTTLLGKALGFGLIGFGSYYLLEPAFSRDKQDDYFEGGGGE